MEQQSTIVRRAQTLPFWQMPSAFSDAFPSTAYLFSLFNRFTSSRFSSEVWLKLRVRCVSLHFETAEKKQKEISKKLCCKTAWLLPRIISSFQIWPNHCCLLKSHGQTCFSKDQKINVVIVDEFKCVAHFIPIRISLEQMSLLKAILSSLCATLD